MWFETAEALPNGFQAQVAETRRKRLDCSRTAFAAAAAAADSKGEFSELPVALCSGRRLNASDLQIAPPKSRRKDFPNVFRL